ncbi:MAG TPA: proteasome accessory factor PafA2 family protein [Candidatus Microsaccharimonas sp.]|nr:proteasome accessory factor PafA2 family protein [Candidatus Microsaccharimonas sp.]
MSSAEQIISPIAYGNEEETGLVIRIGDKQLEDAGALTAEMGNHIPANIKRASAESSTSGYFMQNGGLLYAGGSYDYAGEGQYCPWDNPERATPEVAKIKDLPPYIRAGERLIVATAQNYAEETAATRELPVQIRIQRRTIDSHGNTKASQDNFGFFTDTEAQYFNQNAPARRAFLSFLAARSFMTGAGLVTPDGLYFGQKWKDVRDESGYGYYNTMYRTVTGIEAAPGRVEVRLNDVNISDWAINARVGGMSALMAVLFDERLADELAERTSVMKTSIIAAAHRYNQLTLDPEGGLRVQGNTVAVDYTEHVSDVILGQAGRMFDLDSDAYAIACEMKQYCEDFRKVIRGETSINLLANRSDAMAKFMLILKRYHRDQGLGIERSLTDIDAQSQDLRYDAIIVNADKEGVRTQYGYGYKLRAKGSFRGTYDESIVTHAMLNAPQDTRASLRGYIIQTLQPFKVSWDHVRIQQGKYTQTIPLGGVLNGAVPTELTPILEARKK